MKDNHLRKSMSTTSKIHTIFHFHFKYIARPTFMFLIWICKYVHEDFLGQSNPYIY